LRQPCLFELQTNDILADIGKVGNSLTQAQNEQHGRIDPERYTRVALFDLLLGAAGNESALGHQCRSDATANTRGFDVAPELAQGAFDRQRHGRRRAHINLFDRYSSHKRGYCLSKRSTT
jgi:hypothetical protein